MPDTIDFRLGRVPDIRLPKGANFAVNFTFTGISLSGYGATLEVQSGDSKFTKWSKSGISVSSTAINLDFGPADNDDNSKPFSRATESGLSKYALTIRESAGSGDIVMRLQGEVEWIPDLGDFDTTTAASTEIDVAVSSGVPVTVDVSAGGGITSVTLDTNTATSGLSGMLKAASNTLDVAVAGTDYVAPSALSDYVLSEDLGTAAFSDASTFASSADGAAGAAAKVKTDFLTVTANTDLDAIRSRVNELDAAVVLKGSWDASTGSFPGSGAAQAGWSYVVTVAGTVGGETFAVNDRLLAIADNASTSTYASNWLKLDYTDIVTSVAGRTGAVTLAQADVAGLTTASSPQFTGISARGTSVNTFEAYDNTRRVAYFGNFFGSARLALSGEIWMGPGGQDVNNADIRISRSSADAIQITNVAADAFRNISLRGIKLNTVAVSALPTASSNTGWRFEVSDANSPSLGATVTGGGSTTCEVRSNGANWIVIAIF